MQILYEDNHVLVLNKPAGLLTQPSGTEQDSLETQAKEWIKITYKKPGNVFLEAVHRLDKPVSGIVVFGRTSKALSRLNESIRDKKTIKGYYAIVEGQLSALEGTLEHYMIHQDFYAEIVNAKHPQAKLARLSYKVIKTYKDLSLVEIHLETGRYHQIRLQFSSIGCAIFGDKKYGSTKSFLYDGIALHHYKLSFPHPVKNEIINIEVPLPKALCDLIKS